MDSREYLFMVAGGLIATQKDAQAMTMVWIGLFDVLILKHITKQRENSVSSFATDTTAILRPN